MKEYKIAIKIAGQLEKSFGSSIKSAMKQIATLGAVGPTGVKGFKMVNAGMAVAGAALAAVGKKSIDVGKEFDTAMSSAAATAGATTQEYDRMREAALKMGRETSKTAAESANALEYMSLAGWDVETSVSALPSVLKLSEASGMDLARTSDLVTDSMASLGVTVDKLPGYLDVAAKAQNSSNQSAEQLMEAYLNVGGTMKDLNIPIEESAAALGVMANRGRKGGEAGQALSAIMNNLTTGTGQAGKMMEQLGISAFDQGGNFIGLKATLEEVNNATKGLSDEQRNAALAALGGKQHVKDLNKLLGGLNDTTADGKQEWAALQSELVNSNDALDAMRDMKLDNLEGDMAKLNSILQDTGIAIYEGLQTPLRGAVQFATTQIDKLSEAMRTGGFSGIAAALPEVLTNAVTQAANVLPRIVETGRNTVQSLMDGIEANREALSAGLGRVMTSLASGFFRGQAQFRLIAIQIVQILAQGLTRAAPAIMQSAAESLMYFLEGITNTIPNMINIGLSLIESIGQGIARAGSYLLSEAPPLISNFIQGMLAMLPNVMSTANRLIGGLLSGISSAIPMITQAAITIFNALIQGIANNLPQIVNAGLQLIMTLVGGIGSALPALVASAGQILQALIQGIVTLLPQIGPLAAQIVTTLISSFAALAGMLRSNGQQLFQQLLNGITSGIPLIIQAAAQAILGFIQGIAANAGTIVSSGTQLTTTLAQGLLMAVPDIMAAVLGILGSIIEGILSVDWISVGGQVITAFGSGLMNALGGIGGTVVDGIKGLFTGGDSGSSQTAGEAVSREYAAGISSGSGAIASAAENANNAASGFGNVDTGLFRANGAASVSAYASGIEGSASQVQSAFNTVSSIQPASMPQVSVDTSAPAATPDTGWADNYAQSLTSAGTTITSAGTQLQSQIQSMGQGLTTATQQTVTELGASMAQLAPQVSTQMTAIGSAIQTGSATWSQTMGAAVGAVRTAASTGMSGVASAVTGPLLSMASAVTSAGQAIQSVAVTTASRSTAAARTGMTQIVAVTRTGMTQAVAVTRVQMNAFVAAIRSGGSRAVASARSTASGIRSAFAGMNLNSAGFQAMSGLINGMNSRRGSVMATARSIASAAAKTINDALKIKSPSRVTAESGRYIGIGLEEGMESRKASIQAAAQSALVTPIQDVTSGNIRDAARPNRSAVISQVASGEVAKPSGTGASSSGQGSPTIVYSPTYRFEGEAPSTSDLESANRMSQKEFEKYMKRYQKERGRVAFA